MQFLQLIISVLPFMLAGTPPSGTLHLEVANIQTANGSLRIGIFNKADGFPADQSVFQGLVVPITRTGIVKVSVPNLPFGEYAIAFHQDLDGSGKINTNFLGVPQEPYAFSNNPPAKWRQPKYEQARFNFTTDGQVLNVHLLSWSQQ